MIPIKQTRDGSYDSPPSEHGDCFRACVCSILEVPTETFDSPSPLSPWDEWRDIWQAQLARFNLWLAIIGFDISCVPDWVSPGYWIATVPSLNLKTKEGKPAAHAVVMHGKELAHDPSRKQEYKEVPLDLVFAADWLIQIDPSKENKK